MRCSAWCAASRRAPRRRTGTPPEGDLAAGRHPARAGRAAADAGLPGHGIDHRDHVPADRGEVAELRQQVGDPAVHRGADLGALQIDTRLVELRIGPRDRRLSAAALGVKRFDLALRHLQRRLRARQCRLLLAQLRGELLRILDAPRRGCRQGLVAGRLLLREDQRRLRLVHLGLARRDLRLLHRELRIDALHIGLGLAHGRFGQADRDGEVRRIDPDQHIALVDELVVDHAQRDNAAFDLRCQRGDIGTHRAVARPGCRHVDVPHRQAEPDGQRYRGRGDQQAQHAPRPYAWRHTGEGGLRRRGGPAVGLGRCGRRRGGFQMGCGCDGFGLRHFWPATFRCAT